jgi:hypothetical protein
MVLSVQNCFTMGFSSTGSALQGASLPIHNTL